MRFETRAFVLSASRARGLQPRRRTTLPRPRPRPRSTCRSSRAPTIVLDLAAPDGALLAGGSGAARRLVRGARPRLWRHDLRRRRLCRRAPAATSPQVAGRYGLLVSDGAPVTAGAVQPGTVRVVVSRTARQRPELPELERPVAAQFRQPHDVQLRLRGERATWPRWSPIPRTWSTAAKAAASATPPPRPRRSSPTASAAPTGSKGLQDISTKKGN